MLVNVTQENGNWVATCNYWYQGFGRVRWEMKGTISTDRKLIANLHHKEAPAGWGDQVRDGRLSADGKEIHFTAVYDTTGGADLKWTRKATIAELVASAEYKSLREILNKVPADRIPAGEKWQNEDDVTNSVLHSEVKGRNAVLRLRVDVAEVTRDGRYGGIPRILALLDPDAVTKLPILLYAYFDGADELLKRRVLSHIKHDSINVVGKITRADLTKWDSKGVCLMIDASNCKIVDV